MKSVEWLQTGEIKSSVEVFAASHAAIFIDHIMKFDPATPVDNNDKIDDLFSVCVEKFGLNVKANKQKTISKTTSNVFSSTTTYLDSTVSTSVSYASMDEVSSLKKQLEEKDLQLKKELQEKDDELRKQLEEKDAIAKANALELEQMKKKMEAIEKLLKKTNANDDEDVNEDINISNGNQMQIKKGKTSKKNTKKEKNDDIENNIKQQSVFMVKKTDDMILEIEDLKVEISELKYKQENNDKNNK